MLKKITVATSVVLTWLGMSSGIARADQPWREITVPTVAEAASSFANPPREYAAIHWAIWGGQITKERILTDIEHVDASGAGVYMINNSRGLTPKYFTPEYLNLVKYAVEECKKRGMKVWIEGDAGYPDGFAGGLISRDYPQLGMQGIIPDCHYTIAGGKTLEIPLPTDTLGILAVARQGATSTSAADGGTSIPLPKDGKLKWTAPSGGTWDVTLHEGDVDGHYSVVAGQTLQIQIPPDTKSIDASTRAGARGRGGRNAEPATIIPVPTDGKFKWTAPSDSAYDITFVRHTYRSSPTRFTNRDDGTNDKDSLYSLIDFLDPQATETYLKVIHSTYEKLVGDDFGKTILGFRADETDFTGIDPWTPKLLETFKNEKGYDLQPYIASFFANPLTPEAKRAKADYWDVWSGMFRDNFFKVIESWCKDRNMEYMVHLNHEETMLAYNGGEGMITNEGSFWRDMRFMGVPGVDNLNQIGPEITADFPKLAGSAAHLFGRPLVWDEEGGATGQLGKYVVDYQLVRGINYMNIRGLNAAPPANPKALINPAVATGWYVTRAEHLLAIGRPGAQVALFHPTDSYWLGDTEADAVTVKLTTELLEHQIDFDHLDPDSLHELPLVDGGIKNMSGQVYHTIIVPTSTVIQKANLDRLREFAAKGGKVIFVGKTPTMVVDKDFLNPEPNAPDLSFAKHFDSPEITDAVLSEIPASGVWFQLPCPSVKMIHRVLADGDVYFLFNESNQPQSPPAMIFGNGIAQIWDATTGQIHALSDVPEVKTRTTFRLMLAPYEAKIIVIGPAAPNAGTPVTTMEPKEPAMNLDGDWAITLGTTRVTSPLKNWQDLGQGTFNGIAEYRKDFTLDPSVKASGHRFYVNLGNVGEVARVSLNGKDYDARGWTPFVWDITDSIKSGANSIVVQVQIPQVGGRANFGQNNTSRANGRRGATSGPAATQAGPPAQFQTAPVVTLPHGLLGPVRVVWQ